MTTVTWYRRSLWNYKGNREYTKSGFNLAKERFNLDDLEVDCSDRHYVITGCNSGIGLEIAREIAKRGGVLHMVCRNFESAKSARSDIITNTGNDKIHLHTLDLAKPRDVATWAKDFAATHEKIHVLINNAGCMVHERKIDEDGIETNFAVNTLAVHIITLTLLPIMQRNEDARVVTVSSAGMLVVRLDPMDVMHENMEPFNGRLVYSQNKRQQVVMTLWYAQRYDKVQFSVMHPGWADTNAVRKSLPEFHEQMKDNLRTAAEGADTAVWLAVSKAALKFPSGFFFQDREPASTHLPLAWTKTSMEEENLLMQKLALLTEKVAGDLYNEDINLSPDNTSITKSYPPSNGVASPVASNGTAVKKVEELTTTLSAVSITKGEDKEKVPEAVDELKKDTAEPLIKEPLIEKQTTEDQVMDTVSNGIVVESLSKPVKAQEEKEEEEVPSSGPSPTKSVVSNESGISNEPDSFTAEVESEELSRSTSADSAKEPVSVSTADASHEESVVEPTTMTEVKEPVPESTTDEMKETVPDQTMDEVKEPMPEPAATVLKETIPESSAAETEELAPEPITAEVKDTLPEPTTAEVEPVPESTTVEVEPVPESTTAEVDPLPESPTAELKEEPVPEHTEDEAYEEATSEPAEEEMKSEPMSEPIVSVTVEEPSPEPTIDEIKGEPVIEELVPIETDTPSQVPQTPSETPESETPNETPESETPSETHSPTMEETLAAETKDSETPESIPSQKSIEESLSEQSPSPDVDLLGIAKEDSSISTETKTHEDNVASPSPSEATYQSAASVVEHLIDVTAENASSPYST